jgi:hypothetical protein
MTIKAKPADFYSRSGDGRVTAVSQAINSVRYPGALSATRSVLASDAGAQRQLCPAGYAVQPRALPERVALTAALDASARLDAGQLPAIRPLPVQDKSHSDAGIVPATAELRTAPSLRGAPEPLIRFRLSGQEHQLLLDTEKTKPLH